MNNKPSFITVELFGNFSREFVEGQMVIGKDKDLMVLAERKNSDRQNIKKALSQLNIGIVYFNIVAAPTARIITGTGDSCGVSSRYIRVIGAGKKSNEVIKAIQTIHGFEIIPFQILQCTF